MHPRIIVTALAGVAFDLLCVMGAAAVLLTNNLWLAEVGPTNFFAIVALVGFAMVPVMYSLELQGTARRIGRAVEGTTHHRSNWERVDRSMRTA